MFPNNIAEFGGYMATPAMAYGERRFGAAYLSRIVLGGLLLGIFVGLAVGSANAPSSQGPLRWWIAIGLMVGFGAFWMATGKSVLIINEAGVRTESIFGQKEIAWGQIKHTRYRVIPINAYAHLGLVGALLAMSSKSGRAQLTLELLGDDGRKLKVNSTYRKVSEAIGIILARILPPMVANVKSRLQRGETVQFDGLGLSATAVIWKGSSIPVAEISKAQITGANLQIKRQGKWLSAVSVRSDKIADVLVFLEVLESFAPQIKDSGIDPLARVHV